MIATPTRTHKYPRLNSRLAGLPLLLACLMVGVAPHHSLAAGDNKASREAPRASLPRVEKDDQYEAIYYHGPDQKVAAEHFLNKLDRDHTSYSTWKAIELPDGLPETDTQQRDISQALYYGISELPCVILFHKKRVYAKLFRKDIDAKTVALAEQRAKTAPTLIADFNARMASTIYELAFLLQDNDKTKPVQERFTSKELNTWIAKCRALALSNDCSDHQEQYIRLQFLYPLLLIKYTKIYQGAHTRASEEQFIQAVEELEHARDIDPYSSYGRRAYELRENLRRARLNAKVYD